MLRLVVGVVLLSLTAMNTVAQEGATGVLVFVEGSTVSSFSGSGGTRGGNMGGTRLNEVVDAEVVFACVFEDGKALAAHVLDRFVVAGIDIIPP